MTENERFDSENERTWQGPYRVGKVHVLSEKCSTCVFRPGNLMHLAPGRLKGMVQGGIEEGGAITCHKTLPAHVYGVDGAVCRGYYDAYSECTPALRLAKELDMIVEDPDPSAEQDDQP